MKRLLLAFALGLVLAALPAAAADHDEFFHSLDAAAPLADAQPLAPAAGLASPAGLDAPAPVLLSSPLCEPMPRLCTEVNKEQEYCDCVAAGGNSGFCRCFWCLGDPLEMCKVTRPVP